MRLIKNILKKILPQKVKNQLKKVLSKHPSLMDPFYKIKTRKFLKDLARVLREEKYRGVIIYPPTIDWHMPLFQRPQQLALAFANSGYLFFYCTNNLNHDKVSGIEKISKNLYLTNYSLLLKDIPNSTLLISWPYNKFYAEEYVNSKLIYDYIDELEVFDARGKTQNEMFEAHKYLVKNADLVVCTADKLLNEVKKLKPKNAILAPNAVDPSHFEINKAPVIPEDIADLVKSKKKIIGYYGAIAEWFDYDLLEKTAESRPDYEFVIIGPLDYDKTLSEHKHLFEIKNIHFLGPKKYKDLSSYLYYFNVSTIPFLVNKVTESTSPVKLFEYMAGGRPIVTTNMYECRKYKSVLVAENQKDFLEKIDKALLLSADRQYLRQLRSDALANTWETRAKDIIKNIEKSH